MGLENVYTSADLRDEALGYSQACPIQRSKSSDLIAAPADGLAEDREGLAEETAVNAQRKKADEKVEEGNEDGSTTTTPTSSVARSKDLAAFFRFMYI